MSMRCLTIVLILMMLLGLFSISAAVSSSCPINYQGKLSDKEGTPANGNFAMEFKLYDAATGGNQIGSSCSLSDVKVKDGVFNVTLDFPQAVYNGTSCYLEVTVGGEKLSDRTAINWAPNAIYAATAGKTNSVYWTGVTNVPSSLPPVGPAGGSLMGYYPNPEIADNSIGSLQLDSDSQSLGQASGGVVRVCNQGFIGIGTNEPQGVLNVLAGSNLEVLAQNTGGYHVNTSNWSQSFTAPKTCYITSLVIYAKTETGLPWIGRLTVYDYDGSVLVTQLVNGSSDSDTTEIALNNPVPIFNGGLYSFRLETTENISVTLGGSDPYKGGSFTASSDYDTSSYDAKFVMKARVNYGSQFIVSPDFTYSNYNVGIDTLFPQAKLQICETGVHMYPSVCLGGTTNQSTTLKLTSSTSNTIQSSLLGVTGGASIVLNPDGGNVGVKAAPSSSYKLYVFGTVAGKAAFVNLSDGRYKTNIQPLENALDKVLQLQGVSYNWDRTKHPELDLSSERQVGFIAQEVQKILPEAVSTDDKGTLSIAYDTLTPLLIEAFKEQQKQIEQQNQTLAELNLENEQLLTQCAELDTLKSQITAISAHLKNTKPSAKLAQVK